MPLTAEHSKFFDAHVSRHGFLRYEKTDFRPGFFQEAQKDAKFKTRLIALGKTLKELQTTPGFAEKIKCIQKHAATKPNAKEQLATFEWHLNQFKNTTSTKSTGSTTKTATAGITPEEFNATWVQNTHSPIVDLNHTLPNGVKVRLIGISHGDFLVKKSHATEEYLKKELNPAQAEILIEGSTHSNNSFVPRGIPAISLEDKHIDDVIAGTVTRAIGLTGIIRELFSNLRRRTTGAGLDKPIMVFKKPLSQKQEHTDIKIFRSVTEKHLIEKWKLNPKKATEIRNGLPFVMNTRSALMAAEILHRATTVRTPKVAVMGASHASQAYRFIQNPLLGLRYLRSIREKIRANDKKNRILPIVDRGIKIFETHSKPKTPTKTRARNSLNK